MVITISVAFALVIVAPFVGRWRANVWLKNNVSAVRTTKAIPETA
jgi:hypothetical protein